MSTDSRPRSTFPRAPREGTRPTAAKFDMFESIHQARLKAIEANRKRQQASAATSNPPVPEE